MNAKVFLIIALSVVASGCATDDNAFEQYVETIPTVDRIHNAEASAVLAAFYQIDVSEFTVHWVTSPIHTPDGGEANGVSFDCNIWVYWDSLHPMIDPVATSIIFSNTAMAHEVGHCMLMLKTGDPDSAHTRKDWWYKDGVVDSARAALLRAGM